MSDVHDKLTRSYNMSMIKAKNTKPEIVVRKFLWKQGIRYRLNYSKLPGKPDIVSLKYKWVIFINGCFWHGHYGCKYFKVPQTRSEWWIKKISETKERDIKIKEELENNGWKVFIIWECQLRKDTLGLTLRNLAIELIKSER